MKIIRLTAENVKRLKAVEIEPDGTVQVITGRNAQGKTSVLDAIWLALGGGAASRETARPIRDGEDSAMVELDLGDLIVRRTWTGDKTALTVTAPDGAKYSSPQGILDALVGRLSFDPLAFTRLSEKEQLRALLDVVELPFDPQELDRRRLGLFDQRTEIGREVKRLRGHLASVTTPPEDTPDFEVSVTELAARLSALEALDARHDRAKSAVEIATANVDRLRLELRDAEDLLASARSDLDARRWPTRDDIEAVRTQIATAEETNRNVRALQELARIASDLAAAEAQHDEHTKAIAALDEERTAAIAGATFPIDGLGFTDEGVTYNGVPFTQASAAEQIRVSLAMAMALNPKLRVIRIVDGSLLDADNLQLIADAAAERDFQVWIEKVADGSGVGVVIEDGEVAA